MGDKIVDVVRLGSGERAGVVVVDGVGAVVAHSPAELANDAAVQAALRAGSQAALSEGLMLRWLNAIDADLTRVFDETPTANVVCSDDGRVLACNGAFLKTFGFAAQEQAQGADFLGMFADPRARRWFIDALSTSGSLEHYAAEMRHSDGRTIHCVHSAVASRNASGAINTMRIYVSDRTDERQLEEQLLKSQRMEAVGRLAGGVAHDFNNLLTVIINYADLLTQSVPEPQAALVAEITNAATRAAELTRRLLAFGRRQVLRSVELDLNDVLFNLRTILESLLGASVELDLILTNELSSVRADVTQIEQVILNLAVNARDAMPNGGRLTVETETVLLNGAYRKTHPWAVPGRYVLLTITDTGSGMPASVMQNVFEPFFTTKPQGKGTGLGLASSYGIVRQHNGMIHVYSEVGVGTTFKVYLPVATRPASKVGTKVKLRIEGGMETILVAEDNDSVRRSVVDTLRQRGYAVMEAHSGEEAVRQFGELAEPPALALLDLVMPGISGLETYRLLRQSNASLPVIFTSGYSGEAAGLEVLDDPGVQFLPKPYDPDELLLRVRAALDARAQAEGD